MRFAAALLIGLIGCFDLEADHRVLVDKAIQIGPHPVVVEPERPLGAPGPFNELCLELPPAYHLDGFAQGEHAWRVQRPDGRYVAPVVTLIGADQRREPFPVAGFMFSDKQAICFETRPQRDVRRKYVRAEIGADDTLLVMRVTWSAGKRFASL